MTTQSLLPPNKTRSLRFTQFKRVPLVMQNEANECGIACLAMIANYFGNGISLASLRLAMQNNGQGVNLKSLMEQATTLGMSSRALKVPLNELSALACPAILHWNFSHFVVLVKVTNKGIHVADPALGKRFIGRDELNDSFTGVALELKPNQDFTKVKPEVGLRLRDFAKGAVGLKRQLFLLLGLSLVLQLFAILSPFYMQTVVDEVLVKNDKNLLFALALGFALVLLIDTITDYIRQRLMLVFSTRFSLFLSSSVFSHLLSLPTSYFLRRHMGDIVSRFGSVQQIRELITSGIITALLDGIMALVTLVVMFAYSVQLSITVIVVVALYTLVRWIFYHPLRRLNQESLHADAAEQTCFMQAIRAITTLKLNNSSASTHANWVNKLVSAMNTKVNIASWGIYFSLINKLLFGIENLIVIYLAALLVLDQHFTVGMLFAFVSYKGRFVGAMSALVEKWIEFKMLSVHLERVSDIVLSTPEISATIDSKQSQVIQHHVNKAHSETAGRAQSAYHIEVRNIAFRYGADDEYLFKNLSFTLKHGHSLAIVGQSGSGKSTLMNCLLGLLPLNKGYILIDGRRLSANNRAEHKIAAVMQEDQLLSGSILENISHFDEHIDIEHAIKCAHIACIHDDIMRMTMQYQSTIGDMGDALSGGQKQRLLIARALYRKPRILMLDEASSHLDLATEQRLNAHLSKLNITKIMIAHRQETIASAQHIMQLSEQGIHQMSTPLNDNKNHPNHD